eukprot:scaffold625_cov324-Pavlova_lutheri.AAC.111
MANRSTVRGSGWDAFPWTISDTSLKHECFAMRAIHATRCSTRVQAASRSSGTHNPPLGLRTGVEEASKSALSLSGVGRYRMTVVLPLEAEASGSNDEVIAAAHDAAEAFARPLRERFGRDAVYLSLPLGKQRMFKTKQDMDREIKKVKEGRFRAVIVAFPQAKEMDFVERVENTVSPSEMLVMLNPLLSTTDFAGPLAKGKPDQWERYAKKFEQDEAYAYVQQKVTIPTTFLELLLNLGVGLVLLKRFGEGWSVFAQPNEGTWECALQQRHRPSPVQLRSIAEKYHGEQKTTRELLKAWLVKTFSSNAKTPHFS